MTAAPVILTDVAQGVWLDAFRLSREDGPRLAGSADWFIEKRTLRGGLSDGVDVVTVYNGALSVDLLPTRGMGIWRADYQGTFVGWDAPVKFPVHPQFVNLQERNGLGWLSGFNELMCRCGLAFNGPPGNDNGYPLTLHGRIANRPAHYVDCEANPADEGTLRVTGIVHEGYLFDTNLQLTTKLETAINSNSFTVTDAVTNLSARPAELQLLYHTNFGEPFLNNRSTLKAAVRQVKPRDARAAEDSKTWDRYAPAVTGYAEQAHFLELRGDADNQTTVLLRGGDDLGVSLSFSTAQLPCFTLWKNTQAKADGYVTGLEPGTNYPNFRAVEREAGRVIQLAPGESYLTRFTLAVHTSAAEVRAVETLIEGLK